MKALTIRRRGNANAAQAWPADLHPRLARIYAQRGLTPVDVARARLAHLAAPGALGGIERACELLTEAIAADRRICVVGDFDADGATGTAVALRGLRLLGARNVDYRVPNRFRDGYGLSAGLVEALADDAPASGAPDLILTVDNGIASHAGVAAARARGIQVVVTDHHLPGDTLPDADAIVNPLLMRASCAHESKSGDPSPHSDPRNLAGVGVMFYLLLALRAKMYPCAPLDREEAAVPVKRERPDLSSLLDLVALGTVADLVPLDANNRILVDAGLRRIRAGRCSAGIAALYKAAGRDPLRAVASDLGFALGPRINAAGRLEDMGIGIECLLTDDPARAAELAERLSSINTQRQEMQSAMVEQAEAMIVKFLARYEDDALPYGIVLHEADWHPGIVGLVASKLKERLHRPVIACAPAVIEECGQGSSLLDPRAQEVRTGLEGCGQGSPLPDPRAQEVRTGIEECGQGSPLPDPRAQEVRTSLRGSARSIAGFHLRDALAEVDAAHPGLIERFGGHAMAAGLTLSSENLARFAAAFDAVARRHLDAELLERFIWSDGELAADEVSADLAHALRYAGPWGQAFAEPAFDNVFEVESWRAVGERHLKLQLRLDGRAEALDAILFNAPEQMPPPPRLRAVYQLDLNEWNGRERLQLLVRHIEPA